MKKIKLFILLFVLSVTSFAQLKDIASLGSAITAREGVAWISNYKNQYGNEHGIYYGKSVLKTLLNRSDVEGIYILRGLDNSDREVLVFKAADKDGLLIHDAVTVGNGFHQATKGIAEIGSAISDDEASEMIGKFQSLYKERTPIYLYGKKGFETILNQEGAEGIHFINGLDEKGEEHLIFVGADKKGESMMNATIWNHGSGIFFLINFLARK
jgi:uncharacterized protein YpmB